MSKSHFFIKCQHLGFFSQISKFQQQFLKKMSDKIKSHAKYALCECILPRYQLNDEFNIMTTCVVKRIRSNSYNNRVTFQRCGVTVYFFLILSVWARKLLASDFQIVEHVNCIYKHYMSARFLAKCVHPSVTKSGYERSQIVGLCG